MMIRILLLLTALAVFGHGQLLANRYREIFRNSFGFTIYDQVNTVPVKITTGNSQIAKCKEGKSYCTPTSNLLGFNNDFNEGGEEFSTTTLPVTKDCPDLEVSQWTELSADAPYKYEDVVEVSCVEGYEFQDDGLTGTTATIECLAGGWWSIPRIPTCQPVFCDRPPSVNNGYVSHSEGVTFGNIATYKCFDRLSLSGNENVTCQSDKTWSIPPTCDVLNCELLAPADTSITNHTITAGPDRVDANTYTYGNTVELNCAEGYVATGNVSVACIGYDMWTAPMGTCEKIKCNYVPVMNGMMSTDTTDRTSTTQWIIDQHNRTYFYEYYTLHNMTIKQAEFEDEVHVWCRSGYIISGTDSNTASLTCSSDGEFGVIPTCVNKNECDISQCDHDCTDTEGSFVCTCREFYELGANGTRCNAVTDYCTVYGSRCNGTCNQNPNDPTLFTCSCTDPFVLWTGDGDQAYYQHKDDNSEEYLRANHSCVLPRCPLEAIATALNSNTIIWAHVNDTTRPFYHGQVLEVHCNRGYTYDNGDMMRSFVCESQSNTLDWYVLGGSNLITDFQCDREVTCDGVNSTVSGVTFSSGLEIVCPHPFNYNISYTCDIDPVSNSYMLSPDVNCPVIDCGIPMQDETLGNIDLSSVNCTLYECTFEFACSTGNQLFPIETATNIVCQENGVWNYTNIYCEGRSCPDPGIPANSYRYATADRDDTPLGITNFKQGGTLYFSCINAGYEMKNTDTGLSQDSLSCDGSSFDVTVDKLQCVDVEPVQLDETAVPECPANWDAFKNTAPNNLASLFGFATLPFSDNTGISKLSVSPLEFGHDYIYIEDVNITFTADDFEPSTPETSCTLTFNVQDVVPPVLKCLSEVNITIYNKTHPTPVTESLFAPINVDPEAVLSFDYTQRLSDGELTFSDYDSESLYVTVTATKTYYRGRRSRGTNRTDTMTTTASCIIPVIPQLDACGLDFAPQPAGASGNYEIDGSGVITYTYTCDNAKASFGFDHTSNTRVVSCGTSIGVTDWERVPACTDLTPAVYSLSHILLLMAVTDLSGCRSQLESNFITWLNTEICPEMLTGVTFSRSEEYNGTATNNMVTFVKDTVLMQDKIYFHPSAPGLDTLCAELYYNATKDKWPFDKSGTYFSACAPNVHVSNILLNQFRCPTGLVRAAAGSVEVGGVNYTYDACYPCATGSYSPAGEEFRVKGPCIPCAAGSFDHLEGGDSCSGCATGFGSVEGDVACRVACQEGFYNSETGLGPCIPCPVDTYWVNSTSCESCPTDTSNRDQAQSSPGACRAKCAAGTFSFDGYAPCTNCPMNTYQSATGQTECVRCNPGDETTQDRQTTCTMMATCPTTVSDNCLNSDCVALNGNYLCNQGCFQGRIGPNCFTEIDFCSSLPCNLNGANSCTDGQCLCNNMISNGITCNNITEILCDSKDCQNGGECIVQPSGQFPGAALQAVCLCSGQWSGENCTEVVDRCDSSPCMEGRYETCVNRQVRPECQCKVGYTGYECEIDVDGCESSPCYNHGTCEDLVGAADWGYMCQCLPGFTGRQCEVRLNECEQISCGDNAKCVDDYRTSETVVCLSEFYGPAVSAEVAVETDSWCESLNITCMNGGTCKDTENYKPGDARFYCDCTELYEGVFCQNFINFCETLNGYESCGVGNCTNLAGTTGYYCSFCPDGFASIRGVCENLDECNNPSACNGRGTCINTLGSYYCECEDGYDGQFCQTEINECAMSPCLHDGICSDLFNDFDCTCPPTREGKTCENVMNTCADQCQKSGTCKPVFNNYVCDCIQPSYGRYCQVLHDVCEAEQPCVYGGDCSIDASLNVGCSNCDEGHHGEFCELWSDDCTSQPCINGGNCTLMYGEGYKCRCPNGYTGTNCEIMRDPCNPNPCHNSATCIQETFTEYFCQCAPGFFGNSCDREPVPDCNICASYRCAFPGEPSPQSYTDTVINLARVGGQTSLAYWRPINVSLNSPSCQISVSERGDTVKIGGDCLLNSTERRPELILNRSENYTLIFTIKSPTNNITSNSNVSFGIFLPMDPSLVKGGIPNIYFRYTVNEAPNGEIVFTTTRGSHGAPYESEHSISPIFPNTMLSELNITLQFVQYDDGYRIYHYTNGEITDIVHLPSEYDENITSTDFQVFLQGSDVLYSNITLYSTIVLASELYELRTGRKVEYRVATECKCPRDTPDNFGRWGHLYTTPPPFYNSLAECGFSSRIIPRFETATSISIEEVALRSPGYGEWLSDYTDRMDLFIELHQNMQIFMIDLSTTNIPKKLEVYLSGGYIQPERRPVVYLADDCEAAYKTEPSLLVLTEKFSEVQQRSTTTIVRCYEWKSVVNFQRNERGVPREVIYEVLIPIVGTSDFNNALDPRYIGQKIEIRMFGHLLAETAEQGYYSIDKNGLRVYARPFCNGYPSEFRQLTDNNSYTGYYDYLQTMGTPYYTCQCPSNITGSDCTNCDVNQNQWKIAPTSCINCKCSSLSIGDGDCDRTTGQCRCPDGMKLLLAGKQCNFYIETIDPLYGPRSGGTQIYFSGFFDTENYQALLRVSNDFSSRDLGWDTQMFSNGTGLVTTSKYNDTDLTMKVFLVFRLTEFRVHQAFFSFQYRPDPIIDEILPRQMPLSGGTISRVSGIYIDSVAYPKMTVYFRVDNETLRTFETPCTVKNATLMECETPRLLEFWNSFNPSPTATESTNANATATPTPTANTKLSTLTPAGFNGTGLGEESVSSIPAYINDGYLNGDQLYQGRAYTISFVMGFQLDGVDKFEDLSMAEEKALRSKAEIFVFNDPEVEEFDPEVQDYISGLIEIKGSGMMSGVLLSDYVIEIGLGRCDMKSLDDNRLTCQPPEEEPAIDEDSSIEGHPHVRVRLGNKRTFIGYLRYPMSSENEWVTAVVIAVIVVLGLGVIAVVVCHCVKRKRKEKEARRQQVLHDQADWTAKNYPLFAELHKNLRTTIGRCEIPSDRITIGSVIGKGNFGRVYKGQLTMPNGKIKTVAVKSIKENDVTREGIEDFLKEALIMIDFRHENVLSLIGVVWETGDRPMVIIPYMENGDLRKVVKNSDIRLTVGDLLHFCYQISNGMEYLADKKFVHRDLAARNCMVNSEGKLKIADFGLSRDLFEKDYYRIQDASRGLPIKWMAIESIVHGKFTSKSDVWSYAVTCWEVFTFGTTPYPAVANYQMRRHIENGGRLDKPPSCPDIIFQMMIRCWYDDPEDRPSFGGISQLLATILCIDSAEQGPNEPETAHARAYTSAIPNDYMNTTADQSDNYMYFEPMAGEEPDDQPTQPAAAYYSATAGDAFVFLSV